MQVTFTGYYDRCSPRPSTSVQQLTAEYISRLMKRENMKKFHRETFEETIAQMYAALGKEVNKYRKKVISDTPLRVTATNSVASFRKGHESLKSRTVSPDAFSFESSMCQSESPQEATTYADGEKYPIWIILPDNAVSVNSPEALDEVTETLHYKI